MFTRLLLLGILCLAVPSEAAILLSTSSTWKFRRGTSEASQPDITAWRNAGFNDASFVNAPAPFWYGDTRTGGTQLNDMQNGYTCIFLRQTISVANASQIGGLRLNYYIDDGFIMWINGTEVFRENMSGEPTFATLAANQTTDPAPLTTVTVIPPPGVLLEGDNIVTVQGFNTTSGSSDFGFDCSIESVISETIPPTIVSFTPAAGSRTELTEITVTFSEPVNGISPDDLVVAGIGATGVSESDNSYTFTFAQPPYGEVPITWESRHGITDQASPPNPFNATAPGATWSYTLVDQIPPTIANRFPLPGVTVRSLGQIEIAFSENVSGVDAADLRVNGQAATNLITRPNAAYIFQFAEPASGSIQVTFAAGHGITDQATVPNAFAGGSWNYTLDPNAVAASLVISEINAANQNGLLDEDGEAEDWIEIYNPGSVPADLLGWSLTDDKDLPSQWVFPSRVILPNQYLVVFASGKDRKAPTGSNRFHTNYKLANDGEFIGLYNSDSPRALVSSFGSKFPTQRNDHSYGTDVDGNLRYFATPTPGAFNGSSTITGVVEPVHFSSTRGHYSQAFDLILSCPTPGAIIRYTLDGSEPTESNGTPYIDALRVSSTTLLRAAAFRAGNLSSKVASHSFFFGLSAADRSLPTLSIMTHSNNMTGPTGIVGMSGGTGPPNNVWQATGPNDYHNTTKKGIAWERPVSVEYIDPVDNSGFQVDAGMRVQGSDWTRPRYTPTSKYSYRLYFRGDYGPSRLEYPLMPTAVVNSFDQIVLRAGHNDETNPFITDELMRQLSADMGQVAVHGTLVNLWINGVLKRYFNPTERVEEGFLQSWHGGGEEWDILTVGSNVQGGDNVAWNSLRNYVSSQNVQLASVYQEIQRRMDLTNFADYLILNTYGATWDWPHNNWRAARERSPNGRFRFYVWDAEGAFGFVRSTPGFDSFSTTDSGLLPPSGTAEIPRFYQGLRNSPEFRLLWADRVHKHFFNNGAMTDTNITKRFLELREKVLPVIAGFNNRYLTTWIPQRRPVLLNQYVTYGLMASSNAPVFSQHGGPVPPGYNLSLTIGTGSGTMYYTTDGSDPRVMFTGTVSGSATAYTGPIPLNQGVLVKARTLSGGNWSAVTEATFEVGGQGTPLRISEINYNPLGGSIHEFIELLNTSGAPIDLSGYYFDEGVTFTFPAGAGIAAGGRIILANDTDANAFAIRYPGIQVAGYFSGSLNNSGERLTLRDSTGNILFTVDYKDSGGWPTAADGGGSTLELVSAFGDPDDGANWTASSQMGGTPGAAPTPQPTSAIRISEIMAENLGSVNNGGTFPDWVELQNTSGAPVNIAGWSITDDGNARKYVFPANTTIAAGAYLVLWCDATTNTSPGLHAGFSLSRSDDNVFLYDPATNRIDAVSFGAQLADKTIGRISGEWQLNSPTPNAANQVAGVASASALSINEWMANPLPGEPDWIELYNSSALPVALKGCYLGTTNIVHRISSLSFVAGSGFIQLFADEGVGPDRLDFKLPAAGGPIVLYSQTGVEVDRVSYTSAIEGVTRGRLPDGGTTIGNFSGSASPGAPNFLNTYTGAVLNELLARNRSAVTNAGNAADYIELFNPNGSPFPLDGMSLSVNSAQPGQWLFPVGATVAANGYLVVWCDGSRPASSAPGDYNTGRSLDGESGGAYLFDAQGQAINSIEYGFQVIDRPIGLSGGQWRLLASATPGAMNSAVASLGADTGLRINEWMANPRNGADWFELFNPSNLPVDMSNLYLTDDPSLSGLGQFHVAPLSFIGPMEFVQWIADGDPDQGRDHVSFSLDNQGESIWLFRSLNGTSFLFIDAVVFSAQRLGISEGLLPDGQANITTFPGSATPAESNHLPLPGVVINEILTHTDPPLEDAVELFNSGAGAINISGWYLSDSQDNLKKYRIPDGTIIAAGGHVVLYENQFGNGSGTSFTFDSAHGDEVWLSQAEAGGNLTGHRASAKFGAAENGVSFGRVTTSVGVDYTAMSARTFGSDAPTTLAQFRSGTGLPNAFPKVGPVVIHEIMYNPLPGAEEYVELRNYSAAPVSLFRTDAPFSTWRLSGGVEFTFPANTAIPGSGYLLVVDFDPVASPSELAAFRARYSVPVGVQVLGPYSGQLDNSGETLILLKPDAAQPPGAPDAGFVPYINADRVQYGDKAPWPSGAIDGGGLSLQRQDEDRYGNEPLNWYAAQPSAGAPNGAPIASIPVITEPPQAQSALEGNAASLTLSVTGPGPLGYQWRFNGAVLPDATNSMLQFPYVVLADEGDYDCMVSNPGGAAVSAQARLSVLAPPQVLLPPVSVTNRTGSNVSFSVVARGSAPLNYQWRFKGINLPGATNATVPLNGIVVDNDGEYDVVIANSVAMAISSARLVVLSNTVITVPPLDITVVTGATFTVSVVADGNPLPFGYEWRQLSSKVASNTIDSKISFMTFTAPMTIVNRQSWRVVIRNLANIGISANKQFFITTLVDSDGDEIPDVWESRYGLDPNSNSDRDLDLDGDGSSNWSEYNSDTNPTNALSRLAASIGDAGGFPQVSFPAQSNRTYTVQFRDVLDASQWQRLDDITAKMSNHVEHVTDSNPVTNRFYRVVTPQQQ